MADNIPTTIELKERFHEALRAQHPEWVEPTGACPTCDTFELLLAEQLNLYIPEQQQKQFAAWLNFSKTHERT